MSRDLALDLGSATTRVLARGRGIIVREPTLVALDERAGRVVAVGSASWDAADARSDSVVAFRPVRRGAISDFDTTERFLEVVLRRAGAGRLGRPRVVACVPNAASAVERRALVDACLAGGAREALLIAHPVAAAMGAGSPVERPFGNFVVDVGGETTGVAVISMGGVVAERSIPVGGLDLDQAIQELLRERFGIVVGERTAEAIKKSVGSAASSPDDRDAEVRGRELESGLPRTVVVRADEVRAVLDRPVGRILAAVRSVLGQTPPEIAHDVTDQGILLAGGGSLLRGLSARLEAETGIAVRHVAQAADTPCLGAGAALDAFDRYRAEGILAG